MVPIRLEVIGGGQYGAMRAQIEAEDFFDADKAEIKESVAGGFEVIALNKDAAARVFTSVATDGLNYWRNTDLAEEAG